MSIKKSILSRLESGELRLPTRREAGSDADRKIEETIRFMEETRREALAKPRRPGRPAKTTPRRETEVRGLRLEKSLWMQVEGEAESLSCSVNRYIEESILGRLDMMPNTGFPPPIDSIAEWNVERGAIFYTNNAGSNIITFDRSAA